MPHFDAWMRWTRPRGDDSTKAWSAPTWIAEILEGRLCLSTGYVIAHLTSQVAAPAASEYVTADYLTTHGAVLETSSPAYTVASGTVAPGNPNPVSQGSAGDSGFHIILKEGPNLRANPAAQAAFKGAANYLESVFVNPVTIVVDAEIATLPSNVIGQTSSVEYHIDSSGYDSLRNLMVNNALGNEGVVYGLPTSSQFNAILPTDPNNPFTIGGLTATRANLVALGVPNTELNSGPSSAYDPAVKRDMSMVFNSAFPFDYNQADGIFAGKIDFTGVVEHEIAHGMGFDSSVDDVDYLLSHPGANRAIYPTTMDLFRLLPGNGNADFSNSPRVLVPGYIDPNQVFYDGGNFNPAGINIAGLTMGDIPLSTGQFHGDGHQASHWLDSSDAGFSIGALNPTASFGRPVLWTTPDTTVLGLIGWNIASNGSIHGTIYQASSHYSQLNSIEPGVPGVRVYLDENRDGLYEPWEPSVTTDGLGAYQFYNLTAGDYVVRAMPISGYSTVSGLPSSSNVAIGFNESGSSPAFAMAAAPTSLPWNGLDIGNVSQPGTDAFDGSAFTESSGGRDVWSISDSFHYVYRSLAGDCTVISHVDSLSAGDPWAKAGIMIREGIGQNARNLFLTETRSHGIQFLSRSAPGRHIQAIAENVATLPWLKLVRHGDIFSGYDSADEIHWLFVGRTTIHLASKITVGLAVTAHHSAILGIAGFSGVQVIGVAA